MSPLYRPRNMSTVGLLDSFEKTEGFEDDEYRADRSNSVSTIDDESWTLPTAKSKSHTHFVFGATIFTLISLTMMAYFLGPRSPLHVPPPKPFSTMEKALELVPIGHWGNSSDIRPYSIWGPGLHSAVQGELAVFYVDFGQADGKNDTNNPKLPHFQDVYVALSGPALLTATVTYVQYGRYSVSYRVLDAGVYTLRVDLFQRPGIEWMPAPARFWLPLGEANGYRIEARRPDGTLPEGDGRKDIAIPKTECAGMEDNTNGRWVRCEDIGAPCVRYGWVFLPENCHYRLMSPEEIKQKPLWIMLIGTSVKRGTFMATLDYLLGEAAATLSTSKFWRCWGWLDAQIDNFRISYLDFRPQCYPPVPAFSSCATEDYPAKALEMMTKIARENDGGPDLVVLEVNENFNREYGVAGDLKAALGPDWKGRFVAGFRSKAPERTWDFWYPGAGNKLKEDLIIHPEWGVTYQDIMSMPLEPLYNEMETTMDEGTTFHWHKACEKNNMHICSLVPDMEVQMLMSYTKNLKPRQRITGQTMTSAEDKKGLKFCLQCPATLDFSMRPEAPITCYSDTLPPA